MTTITQRFHTHAAHDGDAVQQNGSEHSDSPITVSPIAARALAVLRIAFGFTFLWAFLDKAFALGNDTGKDAATGVVDRFGPAAWINGGNPTEGFLKFGADGPFASFYHSIAGDAWVNVLFMLALLAIGTALILGIGMRAAAAAGAVLYLMMWSVVLPPANNPIIDVHILGAISLVVLATLSAGTTWGLGRMWNRSRIVTEHPVLR